VPSKPAEKPVLVGIRVAERGGGLPWGGGGAGDVASGLGAVREPLPLGALGSESESGGVVGLGEAGENDKCGGLRRELYTSGTIPEGRGTKETAEG
jgi:hypothetical protein